MSILDLGTAPSKSPFGRNHVKRLLGFGVLVAIVGIGSTFASTLTINSNQAIEFGQGVQQSVFCGGENGSITVTPQSTFTNGEVGTFGLSTISISILIFLIQFSLSYAPFSLTQHSIFHYHCSATSLPSPPSAFLVARYSTAVAPKLKATLMPN